MSPDIGDVDDHVIDCVVCFTGTGWRGSCWSKVVGGR